METSTSTELYYGWKMVWAIMFILTFSSGLSFYNHTLLINALSGQSGFAIETVSLGVTCFFLSTGVTGMVVARIIEKTDPRYCIIVGALIASLCIASIGHLSTPTELYLLYILFGTGFCCSSLLPMTTLVTRWFVKKRAVALSVSSTGLSLGGVVITPFSAYLMETNSFQSTLYILAALYLFGVIPAAWIWLRPHPSVMGLNSGNCEYLVKKERANTNNDNSYAKTQHAQVKTAEQAKSPPHQADASMGGDGGKLSHVEVSSIEDGISLRRARKLRYFWGLCIAYVFLMMAQVGGIAHQFGLARETLSDAETAMAVAILPVASILGRLAGGWVVDLFSIHRFAVAMMVLQVAALTLLALGNTPFLLCIGLFLFGLTVGNLLMLQPLLIAEAFGLIEYARIFAWSNLMTSWGTASGPAILGFAYAANGNDYSWSYLAAAMGGLMGLLFYLWGGKMPNTNPKIAT